MLADEMKGRGMELLAEHGVERPPPIETALDLFGSWALGPRPQLRDIQKATL